MVEYSDCCRSYEHRVEGGSGERKRNYNVGPLLTILTVEKKLSSLSSQNALVVDWTRYTTRTISGEEGAVEDDASAGVERVSNAEVKRQFRIELRAATCIHTSTQV